MPVGLGLAMSHAPSLFLPATEWAGVHGRLVGGVPQPRELDAETPEVIEGYIERIHTSFEALRRALEDYRPDALIVVGDDQREVFGADTSPSMAIYLGAEVSGTTNIGVAGQDVSQNHLTLPCADGLARDLFAQLVRQGFDLTRINELHSRGRPEVGLGHAFTRPSNALGIKELGIPIIPFFLEAYHPPMPTARRCLELGHALRDALAGRPERVAILGSGGMSHDPLGPRAGWIDEPLDRWLLGKLEEGDLDALGHLFEIESSTLDGGTGELRAWLVVAAALQGTGARVLDYLPIHHAVTGSGFVVWEPEAVPA